MFMKLTLRLSMQRSDWLDYNARASTNLSLLIRVPVEINLF